MNLRKYAQDKPCMIRLPGCTYNNDETILCHYRSSGTGMGQKEPDLIGAWGCMYCHNVVDGKSAPPHGWENRDVKLAFLEAILRTQKELISSGIIDLTKIKL